MLLAYDNELCFNEVGNHFNEKQKDNEVGNEIFLSRAARIKFQKYHTHLSSQTSIFIVELEIFFFDFISLS